MIKVKQHKRNGRVVRSHSRNKNVMGHKNKYRSSVNKNARKLIADNEDEYLGGVMKNKKHPYKYSNGYREALKNGGFDSNKSKSRKKK